MGAENFNFTRKFPQNGGFSPKFSNNFLTAQNSMKHVPSLSFAALSRTLYIGYSYHHALWKMFMAILNFVPTCFWEKSLTDGLTNIQTKTDIWAKSILWLIGRPHKNATHC